MNSKPVLALTWTTVSAGLLLCSRVYGDIMLGNVDDFQSGTPEGWVHAQVNANSPTNVPNVGPTGGGDTSLQLSSNGIGGPGSRFLAFNPGSDWTGDYVSAGVNAIQVEFNNIGGQNLDMRLALNGPGGWFITAPVAVNTGGGWQIPVLFPVTALDLTYVGGAPSDISATLSGVTQIQLSSAAAFPILGGGRPRGDLISATAYVDNITAVPEPSTAALLGIGGLVVFMSSRNRRRGNQC